MGVCVQVSEDHQLFPQSLLNMLVIDSILSEKACNTCYLFSQTFIRSPVPYPKIMKICLSCGFTPDFGKAVLNMSDIKIQGWFEVGQADIQRSLQTSIILLLMDNYLWFCFCFSFFILILALSLSQRSLASVWPIFIQLRYLLP